MKKILFYLMLLSFPLLIVSCADDDSPPPFPVPEVPGVNMRIGEIQLVFHATVDNPEVAFEIKASEVFINWGDDTKLHTCKPGEVSHIYPPEDKEYIITIKAPYVTSLNLSGKKTANITEVYLGECRMLMDLFFGRTNKFSVLDLRKCPRFRFIHMEVNTTDFDWDGLNNARSLTANINVPLDINIVNFPNLKSCNINFDKPRVRCINNLQISGTSELEWLHIQSWSYYPAGYRYAVTIENMVLDAPNLQEIMLDDLVLNGDADFRNTPNLKKLYLYGFGYKNELYLNSDLEIFNLRDSSTPKYFWSKESLDLSGFKKLKYAYVEFQPNIKSIDLSGTDKLEIFRLQKCYQVSQINLINLPNLSEFSMYNNASLKEVNIKDLPELSEFSVQRNPELTVFNIGNTPKVWKVELQKNSLDENTIKSIFASFSTEYTGEKTRNYSIFNNPGAVPSVYEYISGLGQWERNKTYDAGFTRSADMDTQSKQHPPEKETSFI